MNLLRSFLCKERLPRKVMDYKVRQFQGVDILSSKKLEIIVRSLMNLSYMG